MNGKGTINNRKCYRVIRIHSFHELCKSWLISPRTDWNCRELSWIVTGNVQCAGILQDQNWYRTGSMFGNRTQLTCMRNLFGMVILNIRCLKIIFCKPLKTMANKLQHKIFKFPCEYVSSYNHTVCRTQLLEDNTNSW